MAGIEETPELAVDSTTEETPHAADESSAPGPYTDLDVDRPPVSTSKPDVPIAHSLVAGAGKGDQNVGTPEAEKAAERAVEHVEPAPAKASKSNG